QTVNVCDNTRRQGVYDWIIRFDDPDLPIQAEIEAHLTPFDSVSTLVQWLKFFMGGRVERIPPEEDILLDWGRQDCIDPDPDYSSRIIPAVETALDQLLLHFLREPYAHRREHNIHTELASLLSRDTRINTEGRLPSGEIVRLIQQEWPELHH